MTFETATPLNKPQTLALVQACKDVDQDFEWYPTTSEILECVYRDIRSQFYVRDGDSVSQSVLDCGAGDGRALHALTKGNKYAIEKSKPLLDALSSDVFVVGCDFNQQTLLDKKVDVVFSNPPYLIYQEWAEKIIREANAPIAYLVIPQRWRESEVISETLKARKAETTILDSFDFQSADRQARAVVDVVRVNFNYVRSGMYNRHTVRVDPFDLWFDANFKINASGSRVSEWDAKEKMKQSMNSGLSSSGELVKKEGLVNVLNQFYNRDLDKLMNTHLQLTKLDGDLLAELNVDVKSVKEALNLKITSLKDLYWRELFDNLDTVTDKLTSTTRTTMLDTLQKHTHVDFSPENAHAVVLWVVKNANRYFDSQLIDMVENLTEKANVLLYKSNQKTFGDEQWRYCRAPSDLDNYKLDYRIVLEHMGGLCNAVWTFEKSPNGLSKRAGEFLDDLMTIALNLGFDTAGQQRAGEFTWDTHVKNMFMYRNHVTGQDEVLFEAKAFRKGTLHIKFNQRFICRLNVEFGRLKGWLKSAAHAADELSMPIEDAELGFNSNLQLTHDSVLRLGFRATA